MISLVQNYGVLLVCDQNLDFEVVQVSSNTNMYTAFGEPEGVLGCRLSDLFASKQAIKMLISRVMRKNQCNGYQLELGREIKVPRRDDIARGEIGEAWWDEIYGEEQMSKYLESCEATKSTHERSCAAALTLRGREEDVHVIMYRMVHGSRECVIVEIFPLEIGTMQDFEASAVVQDVHDRAAALTNASSLSALLEDATTMVFDTSGADRVMLYKFAKDDSGLVLVEKNRRSLDTQRHKSFLGLKFPGGDIPKQARALFARNKVRHTQDINEAPAELVPRVLDGLPIDLSDSRLRAPSPIHIRYLRNIGVRGTTSLAVIFRGRLWGLFACHHFSGPLDICPKALMHLQTIGAIFSSALEVIQAKENREANEKIWPFVSRLRNEVENDPVEILAIAPDLLKEGTGSQSVVVVQFKSNDPHNEIIEPKEGPGANLEHEEPIAEISNSSGGSVSSLRGSKIEHSFGKNLRNIKVLGDPVDVDFVLKAGLEICSKIHDGLPSSDCLKQDAPNAWSERNVSGGQPKVCGIAVARCVICDMFFVRHESKLNVKWAGAAALEAVKGNDSSRLHPRASFEEYNQIVQDMAKPLDDFQVDTMFAFKEALLIRAERTLERERERTSKLAKSFLASMSHELRTPFNGIVGMLSVLLQEEGLSQHAREMLTTINRSTEAMLNILDDILTVSKLEEGRLNIKNAPFVLRYALSDVQKLFQVRCESVGISFETVMTMETSSNKGEKSLRLPRDEFRGAEKMPIVYFRGDGGRIRQVLVNLIGNAVKFVNEGTGVANLTCKMCNQISRIEEIIFHKSRIFASASHDVKQIYGMLRECDSRFRASHVGEHVQWLYAVVEDNGIGIDRVGIRKLFQKFEQLDSGTRKMYQGTGLGLAICSQLCSLMGGMIWCFSNGNDTPPEFRKHIEMRTSFQFAIPLSVALPESDVSGSAQDPNLETSTFRNLVPSASTESTSKDAISRISNVREASQPNQAQEIEEEEQEGEEKCCLANLGSDTLALFTAEEQKVLKNAIESDMPICIGAEDNEINRTVLKMMFSSACPQFQLALFHGGVPANKAFQILHERVAFAALDFHMPDRDGLEVAQRIRALDKTIPIYLITADTSLDEKTFAQLNISGVVQKPITIARLKQAFQDIPSAP